ncbi:MAG: acyl-CoA synthetase [Rhodospirillales bacterium]|nr:acyl-CoA synthetase [Rhodospirillales bacterium]
MSNNNRYERGLERGPANHVPLTPCDFLARAAAIYPVRTAVVHGALRRSYAETYDRCRRLAGALAGRGVGIGDTVSILAPNVPAMLEAHFGVPMAGAVLNALNIRLDAASIAAMLGHAQSRVLIADAGFASVVEDALAQLDRRPHVVAIDDSAETEGEGRGFADESYEELLAAGSPDFAWPWPEDEWQAISLNYTSGTTGRPKGVVYHHRGAYLNALSNVLMNGFTCDSVYLWTLPMFHCNGWTHTWAVTAAAGAHICLLRIEPAEVFRLIAEERVTHMAGAPVVLGMLINAPEGDKRRFDHVVEVATGGAAPPAPVIAAMEEMGFNVTHLYGLTEVYGPALVAAPQEDWPDLPLDDRAALMARQGVRHPAIQGAMVADPETLAPVPADGATTGEIMLRGNTVMKGYLDDAGATAEAFGGGWFHTGDLAVTHPDGYIQITDRAKDIIISGGENISSIEVENALYSHEAVLEAAVVARPDERWGETPCAFVALKPDAQAVSAEALIDHCRARMARFKVPRTFVFGELPKTATGKIMKFELRERALAVSSEAPKEEVTGTG